MVRFCGWTLVISYQKEVRTMRRSLPLGIAGVVTVWGQWPAQLYDHLGGAVAGAASLWAIRRLYRRLRGREGLGLGDVKLLGCNRRLSHELVAFVQSLRGRDLFKLPGRVRGQGGRDSRHAASCRRIPPGSQPCQPRKPGGGVGPHSPAADRTGLAAIEFASFARTISRM